MNGSVTHWDIVISGFLQSEGKATGMVALWQLLRENAGPSRCVILKSWNDSWSDLAERIRRVGPKRSEPTVCIYAYSWGAGHGAITLAKELRTRGIRVAHMVLCDPVYRSWLISFRWLAMLKSPNITIPDNVNRVSWFRQKKNRPAGHDLHPENGTQIEAAVWLPLIHQDMDDAPEFHAKCICVAGQFEYGL